MRSNALFFFIFICFTSSYAFNEAEFMPNPDSVSILLTTRVDARLKGEEQNVKYILNFSQGQPLFYFELSQIGKKIFVTLVNTRLGGFMLEEREKTVNKGPLKKVAFIEELKDKNQDVAGLNPEFYYVTTMIMDCDPLINDPSKVIIEEKNETITISLPWPSNLQKRKELYSTPDKKGNRKLIAVISGIGAAGLAGGGILLWNLLSGNDDETPLKPVLPEHP
ncbi:MAG: hypothetical protein JW915_01680 [Chitinispirillaceae bacterium]|nr:hypothetical protein [Chitinispirillaceae bacterium]